MKRLRREDTQKAFIGFAGWLFADLLLALAVLFLIANTITLPDPLPPPTPTKTTVKPTVVPPPQLEQHYHRFRITIDSNKLLNNDTNERKAVMQQVQAQAFLRKRNAGLMVVFGGAPTVDDIQTAQTIASTVYGILLDLGKQDSRFKGIARYDPLYVLGSEQGVVIIDIFLFVQ